MCFFVREEIILEFCVFFECLMLGVDLFCS